VNVIEKDPLGESKTGLVDCDEHGAGRPSMPASSAASVSLHK
jgi:hypothetical protein